MVSDSQLAWLTQAKSAWVPELIVPYFFFSADIRPCIRLSLTKMAAYVTGIKSLLEYLRVVFLAPSYLFMISHSPPHSSHPITCSTEILNGIQRNQRDAQAVADWVTDNGLQLNLNKSKVMILGSVVYITSLEINIHSLSPIFVNNTPLRYVELVKKLGI